MRRPRVVFPRHRPLQALVVVPSTDAEQEAIRAWNYECVWNESAEEYVVHPGRPRRPRKWRTFRQQQAFRALQAARRAAKRAREQACRRAG